MPKKKSKKKGSKKKGRRSNAESWVPSKGETLEGEIVRMQDEIEVEFRDGPGESSIIEVEDEDGDRYAVWCGDSDREYGLRVLFDEASEGDEVEITFIKTEKGQYGRKVYEVELNGEELDLGYDDDDD